MIMDVQKNTLKEHFKIVLSFDDENHSIDKSFATMNKIETCFR